MRLRAWLAVASLALVVLVSGCNKGASANLWAAAGRTARCSTSTRGAQPGVRFDTAAGAQKDETLTCAAPQAGHPYPFLTVAAAGTTADALIFEAT